MSGEHQAASIPEFSIVPSSDVDAYANPLEKVTRKVYPIDTAEVNEKARQEVAESQERISRAKTFDTLISTMTKLTEASDRLVKSVSTLVKFVYLVLVMQCFVMAVTLTVVTMIYWRGK